MSLDHKNVVRMNDQFQCTHCGKSWDITDADPPNCTEVVQTARKTTASPALGAPYGENALWPTPSLEERFAEMARSYERGALQQADFQNLRCPLVAWLVTKQDEPARGIIVYAADRAGAVAHVESYATKQQHAAVPVNARRLGAMDDGCVGTAIYTEMSPARLRKATKAARISVMTIFAFCVDHE